MKKYLLSILALVCVLLCLASCGKCQEHTYGEWETQTPATCTAEGTEVRTCRQCGQKDTRSIPLSEHRWGAWSVKTAATCTATGERHRHCTVCNREDTELIAAADHIFGEAYVATEGGHARVCETCGGKSKPVAHVPGAPATETTDQTCTVCGATIVHATGHTMEKTEARAATCAQDGNIAYYTCRTCRKMYRDEAGTQPITNVTVKKLGHLYAADPSCTDGQKCTREGCEHTVAALGHDYQATEEVPLTCTQDHTRTYLCSHCGDTYTVILQRAQGHQLTSEWQKTGEDTLMDGETCRYTRTYTASCANPDCEGAVRTEIVTLHDYRCEITKPATCTAQGDRTYTCRKEGCADRYVTHFDDPSAHKWNSGVTDTAANATVYTCENCSATQTEYQGNSATVPAEQVKKGAIKLDEATIDASAANLDGNLTLGAENKTGEVALPENVPQDSTVYAFTMSNENGNIHSFSSAVTVKIPYTLRPGDDPDNIVIFYLTEQGVAQEPIPAVYQEDETGKGYAVFTVDHFSYYTVTYLSAEERCFLFGHDYGADGRGIVTVTRSCTKDGYTLNTCLRCGAATLENFEPATGHLFVKDTENSVAATCVSAGKDVFDCHNEGCSAHYEEKVAALGHDYAEVAGTKVAATCTAVGKVTVRCARCQEEHIELIPQKAHVNDDVLTPATCTSDGYTTHTCRVCGAVTVDTFVPAPGHEYEKTVIAATCTTDGYTTYVCKHCDLRFNADVVAAAHKKNMEKPTCGAAVVCTVCAKVLIPPTGEHTLNADGICTVCGQGCEHHYAETIVLPTCEDAGYTLKECTKCHRQEKSDYTAARGHQGTFTCTVCGKSLLREGFFKTCYRSISEQKFALVLRDMKLVMPQHNYETDVTDLMTQSIDFAELFLDLDENQNAVGYGSGVMRIRYGATNGNFKVRAILRDSTLYVEINGADVLFNNMSYLSYEDMNTTYYMTFPLSYVFDAMELPVQNPDEMLKTAIGMLKKHILPLLEKTDKVNTALYEEKLSALVQAFFTVQEENGEYVFTLSTDALKELLACQTVCAMYDKIFADGAFRQLRDEVVNLASGTIGDVLLWLKSHGLDIQDVLAAGDALARDILNDRNATINDLIVMIPGMAQGDQAPDIAAILQQMSATSIASLFLQKPDNEISDQQRAEFKAMVENTIDRIGQTNVYDLIGQLMTKGDTNRPEENTDPDTAAPDAAVPDTAVPGEQTIQAQRAAVREITEAMLDMVKQFATVSFTTDKDGNVKQVRARVKIDDLSVIMPQAKGASLSLQLSLSGNYTTPTDFSDMPAYREEDVVLNRDTFAAYANTKNLRFHYDEDGNLVAIEWVKTQSLRPITLQDGSRIRLGADYAICYRFEDAAFLIEEDCVRAGIQWLIVSAQNRCTQQLIPYAQVYDAATHTWVNTDLTDEHLNILKMSGRYGLISYSDLFDCEDFTRSMQMAFVFRYDTKNGRGVLPKINSYGFMYSIDSLHEYEEDASLAVEAVGCTGIGEKHFVCKHCGKTYTEYYMNGHKNLSYEGEFVTPQTPNCQSSAVKITVSCGDCHQVISVIEREKGFHYEYPHEIIDLSQYTDAPLCGGKATATVKMCLCGQDRYISFDISCHMSEQSGYLDENGNFLSEEEFFSDLKKSAEEGKGAQDEGNRVACRRYTCAACGFTYYEFVAFEADETYPCIQYSKQYYAFGNVKADPQTGRLVTQEDGKILFRYTQSSRHTDQYRSDFDKSENKYDSQGRLIREKIGYECTKCHRSEYEQTEYTWCNDKQYPVKYTQVSVQDATTSRLFVQEYKLLPMYERDGTQMSTFYLYICSETASIIRIDGTTEIPVEQTECFYDRDQDGLCQWTIVRRAFYNKSEESDTPVAREEQEVLSCFASDRFFGGSAYTQLDDSVNATCTQSGTIHCFCHLCQHENYEREEPRGHKWVMQEDSELWRCYQCGTTSRYGADGPIDLEDLTELTGEGEGAAEPVGDTVKIGYYVRNHFYPFQTKISMVFGNGMDFVLDFHDITDDGSTLSFRASALLDVVMSYYKQLAENGEITEGMPFTLVLQCVPEDEENNFVCSITFFSSETGYLVNQ